jgi:uncharacterized protein (DUF488 family)
VSLLTVGHGTLDGGGLVELVKGAGVQLLVDVRRFPGSRRNPTVSRDSLAQLLPAAGIDYRWDERLGGRRSLPDDADGLDAWWQVKQFRAYAAHTRTPEFAAAMSELVGETADRAVTVLCSESVWWRCHRRLVADVAVLAHATPVSHLMHDGRRTEHQPSAGARLRGDGEVVWDRLQPASTAPNEPVSRADRTT